MKENTLDGHVSLPTQAGPSRPRGIETTGIKSLASAAVLPAGHLTVPRMSPIDTVTAATYAIKTCPVRRAEDASPVSGVTVTIGPKGRDTPFP